jgi:Predicted permease
MFKNKMEQNIPLINTCLIIIAAAALTWILIYTKNMLMPFVIALFISIVSNTISAWMKDKWQVPRTLGLILSATIVLAALFLVVLFISNSIESFISGADIYSRKLTGVLEWSFEKMHKLGLSTNTDVFIDYFNKPLFDMVKSTGSGLLSLLTSSMLVFLFVIFMLIGSSTEKSKFTLDIEKQISYYLLIKIAVSLMAAFFVWIVLSVVKTELALMFAIITFMLNFIPNIGPVIATLLPAPVLFLQYGFAWQFWFALIAVSLVHFVVGNILETRWLGKGMDLNPVVVLACLIFWALVWGPMGALLAVPLTSIIKIILEKSSSTKPFADILAGRLPFK